MTFEDLDIKTKPGRKRYATTCPQCDHKREKHKGALCLTVNDEPGNRWYKCHHCGWSGNLDVEDKYDVVKEKAKMPSQEQMYSKEARDYIQGRGLSINSTKAFGVYEIINKHTILLGFPFYMNHTLVNVKFLNTKWKEGDKGPKWYQLPQEIGTRVLPFGMQNISWDEPWPKDKKKILIITEGEWDAVAWYEAGFRNVVSVPKGAPSLSAKNFDKEFLWLQDPYVKSVFSDVDLFYLSTDNDAPGKNLRDLLAMILGKDKCRYVQYPVGYKDMNEILSGSKKNNLAALGIEGVKECYSNVASIPIKGIIRPSDVYDDLNRYRKEGFTAGLGIGIPEIDKLFTLKPKHITFVTGTPGAGKSVFVRWYLAEMVRHNADLMLKFAMFTPENRPVSREYAKIAEVITGQGFREGVYNSMNDEVYRQTMRFIQKHFFLISPDRSNYESFGDSVQSNKINTMGSLMKYLEYLKKTENIFGYVIDAWNKIEHEQPKWQAETTFISEQLDNLISFNDYWDLHGIVIVHPKKIEQQGLNYKMPSLYDIKGSSAWKEKADIGIIVHRYKLKRKKAEDLLGNEDEDEKWYVDRHAPTIVRTEKIRFEEIGNEDRVRLRMASGGRFVIDDDKQPVKDTPNEPKMVNFYDPDDYKDESDLPF